MKKEQETRQKHDYTSELELKSLLIRIKNTRMTDSREEVYTEMYNKRINKYIKWFTKINNKKYVNPTRRNLVKAKLKEKVIKLSEITIVDRDSYEQFGAILLLMIKNILKKPQFSGYTYRDEFYSDAVHKVLKYLCNFNHLLISEITNQPVNSFAYISQIIHNSIIFIINTKKKELINIKKQISMECVTHDYTIIQTDVNNRSTYNDEDHKNKIIEIVELNKITSLYDEILKFKDDSKYINIYYPEDYRISFEEYDRIKPILNGKINIMRKNK